ncbi:MAG TPA: hypothetical protein VJX67_22275 [Blastocatellia bacterium]|nr:hypothetical protein [Blastocatellia bacterium]
MTIAQIDRGTPANQGQSGTSQPRILVACSMKSGSTFISRILARYFDAAFPDTILGYYGYREQNLSEAHLSPDLGPRYVLHLHIKPYPPHLELIERHGIKVLQLWRNLGDTVISVDDHILREHIANPVCYVDNDADYRGQPAAARHKYVIQHGLPWYISFHLAWKRLGRPGWLVRGNYEEMARDPAAFFRRVTQELGFECDMRRLQHVLDTDVQDQRFNVGIVGRSIESLSEDNKILLERLLIEHPQDLSELLHELPWWPSDRGRILAAKRHDGGLIRIAGTSPNEEMVYLVRDGKRRWITSPEWFPQNGRTWGEVSIVPDEELRSIPLGPPLGLEERSPEPG